MNQCLICRSSMLDDKKSEVLECHELGIRKFHVSIFTGIPFFVHCSKVNKDNECEYFKKEKQHSK